MRKVNEKYVDVRASTRLHVHTSRIYLYVSIAHTHVPLLRSSVPSSAVSIRLMNLFVSRPRLVSYLQLLPGFPVYVLLSVVALPGTPVAPPLVFAPDIDFLFVPPPFGALVLSGVLHASIVFYTTVFLLLFPLSLSLVLVSKFDSPYLFLD